MVNPEKILFKYASRSRPSLFFRGLDSIVSNLFDKENYHVLCTFDLDDLSMNNPEVIAKLDTYKNISYYFGESKSKIEAINNNLDRIPEDTKIIINFSDDQIFTSLFFDRTIRQAFGEDYDLVVHFPDQAVKAALMTMSIMGIDYFDRFNYIYHPDFISLFCDNESQDVARILGKYKYVDINIFKHLHPAWQLSQRDEQYVKTESFYRQDEQTYLKRKYRNFDLNL